MRSSNSLRWAAAACFLCLGPSALQAQSTRQTTDEVMVRRLANNPIVTADLSPSVGINIQGPSLIRVPDWLPNPLGRYYLSPPRVPLPDPSGQGFLTMSVGRSV